MTDKARIVVLTSCTGQKAVTHAEALQWGDFEAGIEHRQRREQALADYRLPAEELYTGRQHERLMGGVVEFRDAHQETDVQLDLWIVSAGYGVVPGDRLLAPYECTFNGMKKEERRRWADHLQIPAESRKVLAEPYDLALILLGDTYLEALALDEEIILGGPTLVFCGKVASQQLSGIPNLFPVELGTADAKSFSCGMVGLKGEVAGRLLRLLGDDLGMVARATTESPSTLLALLKDVGPSVNGTSTAHVSTPASEVDWVVQLGETWWEKPHRQRLRYFIPEWDDRVDPYYDFETDTHGGGTGDWSNEMFAHQLYQEPNYDGILVSKIVAERSQKKKERINQLGVHRYLRVPDSFPIMGDCGAFGYVNEEVPPYTTSEILDYYTRLGFDYGVSLDHLIFSSTEEQKHFRYELTISNAEEFLTEHRRRGLEWEPIGAVQGWDATSYAEAARQYVAMGYRYIALGGLVRSRTEEILAILEEVHAVVPPSVAIHLFGIARFEAIEDFNRLGVRSIDSASHLRRAWVGAKDNYWTLEGQVYAAIRIPSASSSFRAKRIVQDGRATASQVERLESESLRVVRAFDRGEIGVEETLDVLEEYDQLITPDRRRMRDAYRLTLTDKPWERCPCAICQRNGVEVIIFRGNNRNRRRGFHNTYVFYRLLQNALEGEIVEVIKPGQRVDPRQLSLFGQNGRQQNAKQG